MGDKESHKKNNLTNPQGIFERGVIFVDAFIKARKNVFKKLANFDSKNNDKRDTGNK